MDNTPQRFTAAQIAEACGGRLLCGRPQTPVADVCTDTRRLRAGGAFFALVGPRHDGHDYLDAAVLAGASVLVAQRPPERWRSGGRAAVVLVDDTARALLALASWHRSRLPARVAAVTGSYGKSTTKDMLGAILGMEARCTVAPASFNNRIGVARTLLSATAQDDFVVLEMGTNHPGEIDELARAGRPDLGVITAIGEVHLEGLGSIEGVAEAKAELIPHLPDDGVLVVNGDDDRCLALAERFAGEVRTFGMSAGATVRPERIHDSGDGPRFDAGGWVFSLPAGPRYNVLNAAAAICASLAMGASPRAAAEALAHCRPPAMRYERRRLGGVTFICDCYNSSPPALRAAVGSFLLERHPGRKVVVCGDMLELGEQAERLHREAGAHLAAAGVDVLVAVGALGPYVIEGWHRRALPSQSALYFPTADETWSPLWWELKPGDAVLLKGSRAARMETIVENTAAYLESRGEEAA